MGPRVALSGFARIACGALVLAALIGCGSERPQASPLAQALGAVAKSALHRGTVPAAGAGTAAQSPVTRAELEKLGTPVLQVSVAARAIATLVTPSDVKGNVVTWSSQDGMTFTFRDGILIQTRGLGPDLMSAQAPSVAQLLSASSYERAYYFLGADDQPTRRKYTCTPSIAGHEQLDILERSYSVTHVVETCTRPQGSMTNEYWIDGTTVRSSHELLSGGAGYLDLARIID